MYEVNSFKTAYSGEGEKEADINPEYLNTNNYESKSKLLRPPLSS
jgi:hypothetical protein